jgi:hypothetical protein
MSLSPLDDYPIHQIAEPIRHVQTSDRNFYDRYYFCVHNSSKDFFMVFGSGQYPNLATQDAFVAVRIGGQQKVLRSSRELGERGDLSCGPFRIEVLEGLKRLRLVIAPNESGIECDLVFEGAHPPQLEPRQFERRNGRVLWDTLRYGQNGFYKGRLKVGDVEFDLDPLTARGFRDRSWGIRPTGEVEPSGIHAEKRPNFMWLYTTAQFDEFSLMLKVHEEDDGHRHLEEATRIWNDPNRPVEHLGRPEFSFEAFDSDHNFIDRMTIRCPDEQGRTLELGIEMLLPLYLDVGTGYGARKDWRHGMYQGKLKTESLCFDLAAERHLMNGLIDSVGRYTLDGMVGHGLFEYGFVGRFKKAGIDARGWWNWVRPPIVAPSSSPTVANAPQ